MRVVAWTDFLGITHRATTSLSNPEDWDIACDQPVSRYGAQPSSILRSIKKTARARRKRQTVTCLLCVAAT